MNNEIKIEDILQEMRNIIANYAQEVAILKAQIQKLLNPTNDNTGDTNDIRPMGDNI